MSMIRDVDPGKDREGKRQKKTQEPLTKAKTSPPSSTPAVSTTDTGGESLEARQGGGEVKAKKAHKCACKADFTNKEFVFKKPADHSPKSSGEPKGSAGEDFDGDGLEWDEGVVIDDMEYDPKGTFLFEFEYSPSNRLVIPVELAADFFPALLACAYGNQRAEILQITDCYKHKWFMPLVYYHDERAFMFRSGWEKFAARHDIRHMDTIRFLRPIPRLHTHHYQVEIEHSNQQEPHCQPEFREENFMFQVELTPEDIVMGRLVIDKKEVKRHLLSIRVPENKRKQDILRLTDRQAKDWYMNMVFYSHSIGYMLMSGWNEFVMEKKLQAMDSVRFFRAVEPHHERHFLVDSVKLREADTHASKGKEANGKGKKTFGGKRMRVS